jgi:hypothetical protein
VPAAAGRVAWRQAAQPEITEDRLRVDDDQRRPRQSLHGGQLHLPVAEHGPALQLRVHPLGDDHVDVAEDRAEVEVEPVGVGTETAQVDPDVTEHRARASGRRRPAGQPDVAEDAAHLFRRAGADDLDPRRGVRREVGHQQVQLGAGHRGVRGMGALTELVEVDAPLGDGRLQPGHDRLPVRVGGPHDRRTRRRSVVGHGSGR